MQTLKKWHLSTDRLTVKEGNKKIATFYDQQRAEDYANDHNRLWVDMQPLTKKDLKECERMNLYDRALNNWESVKLNAFGITYKTSDELFRKLLKGIDDKREKAYLRDVYKDYKANPADKARLLEWFLSPNMWSGHVTRSMGISRKLPKI